MLPATSIEKHVRHDTARVTAKGVIFGGGGVSEELSLPHCLGWDKHFWGRARLARDKTRQVCGESGQVGACSRGNFSRHCSLRRVRRLNARSLPCAALQSLWHRHHAPHRGRGLSHLDPVPPVVLHPRAPALAAQLDQRQCRRARQGQHQALQGSEVGRRCRSTKRRRQYWLRRPRHRPTYPGRRAQAGHQDLQDLRRVCRLCQKEHQVQLPHKRHRKPCPSRTDTAADPPRPPQSSM